MTETIDIEVEKISIENSKEISEIEGGDPVDKCGQCCTGSCADETTSETGDLL